MEPVSKDEYDQHKEVCGRAFNTIIAKLDSIDKRLFRDNGTVSVQTRIDRHEQTIGTIKRLTWIITAAVIGILATALLRGG